MIKGVFNLTLEEIRDKKLTCVVHTKSEAEAKVLAEYLPWWSWSRKPSEWWSSYGEQSSYYIENGELLEFSPINFYKKRYPHFGEVYEFSDLIANEGIIAQLDRETAFNGLSQALKRVLNIKEEKELKFTFYVTEGTRPDKKCNGIIPTMTTTVVSGLDEVSVTCDKVDFDERQGVLEGIAQLYCKGRFDKEYEAAVKLNKRGDEANRTCIYCGKIFDTAEERVEHEAWHVERKKARRERYLLRKRAKEIAFEEQAQKMAKEMIKEDK